MEVIAKTNNGVLIQATESEVQEILNAVHGKRPESIQIGMKIPAIDYASSITKLKALSDNSDLRYLQSHLNSFKNHVDTLTQAVKNVQNLES